MMLESKTQTLSFYIHDENPDELAWLLAERSTTFQQKNLNVRHLFPKKCSLR